MFNPMQIMQMIKGGNPQQMLQQLMGDSQMMQNPMARNTLEMAQKGNIKGIEQLGRNMAAERGVDFDKAFSDFKNQFGL